MLLGPREVCQISIQPDNSIESYRVHRHWTDDRQNEDGGKERLGCSALMLEQKRDNRVTLFLQLYFVFVNLSLFWHRVSYSHFLSLKFSLLDVKMRKTKERQTFRPHMGALFSAINS